MRPRIPSESESVLPGLYGRSFAVSASKMSAMPITRDLRHTRLVLGPHAFAADVGPPEELAVVVVLLDARGVVVLGAAHALLVVGLERLRLGAQHVDLGLALEDLETRGDVLDAVVDRLQLGRLVHHVDRRGDLAAIVQKARDLEFVAVLLRHAELCKRTGAGVV